ncbi:winged helix-turn-helix domain-containing protein [Xanthobacter sp. DSM 24535]|uniref:ATP-binding protein n=1 Tax=Roseixanthobacter psychrophilus TaxID=3119917 RepID=UPI003728C812
MPEIPDTASAWRTATFGPYTLNPARRRLARGPDAIQVGSRAMDLLIALVESAGQVLSHRRLLAHAWPSLTVEEANLRVHISALRKTLAGGEADGEYIENLVGRGYCFVAPVTWSSAAPAAPPVTGSAGEGAPAESAKPQARAAQRLPLPATRVVGLDPLVDHLVETLNHQRFITLVSPGGMGKTTAAIFVGRAIQTRKGGEVAFVDLSPVRDPNLVASALATTLGIVSKHGQTEEIIISQLQGRPMLLILDNCEHLIDAAAALCGRLFGELPDLCLLATSREALRVEGEHVHLLPPLATPPAGVALTAAEALTFPAVQLFMERAATSGHRAPLDDEGAELVADICRRLDGMALAIELAASRAGAFGLRGVVDMLSDSVRLYWEGRRGAPARHQTLDAVFDWSYALLSPRDRRVLRHLSIFAGLFTLKDALTIAADDEDRLAVASALTGLVDKSLIWASASGSPVYFRLLDTTRAFANAKLQEVDESDAVSHRLVRHLIDVLRADKLDTAIFSSRDLSAHAVRLGDIRASLRWCLAHAARRGEFIELAAISAPLFLALALLGECESWCRMALETMDDEARGNHVELLLLEGLTIGAMFTRGNRGTISSAIAHGQALAASLNEPTHELHLLGGEHIFLTRIGNFRGSLSVAERCSHLSSTVGTPEAIAMAEWMIGCSHHLLGDQRKSQVFGERGFEHIPVAAPTNVDYFGYDHRVRAMEIMARTLWLRGDTQRSARFAEDSIREAERRGHPVSICIALMYTGEVALWNEELDLAEHRLSRASDHASRHALVPYRVVSEGLMGALAVLRGRVDEGVSAMERALGFCQIEDHHVITVEIMVNLARGQGKLGLIDAARATSTAAVDKARAFGGSCFLADLLLCQAELEAAAGAQVQSVDRLMQQALDVAKCQSAHHLELKIALARHRLCARDETASALADICGQFAEKAHSPFLSVARRLLTAGA